MADRAQLFDLDVESTIGSSNHDGLVRTHDRALLVATEPRESKGPLPWRHRASFRDVVAFVSRRVRNSHLRTKLRRPIFFLIIGYLSLVGLVHVLSEFLHTHVPDDMDFVVHPWLRIAGATIGVGTWLSDATQDVHPVRCHSHNDYWRTVPLFDAIAAGCASVEADVWYQNDDLYVGHRQFQLRANHTLRSLYIDPLVDMLDQRNKLSSCDGEEECDSHFPDQPLAGVFQSDPDQPLVLLIDFKTPGPSTWRELQQQLKPLRDRKLLTYFNGEAIVPGPVVIVATGYAQFDDLTANDTYGDVFYDAPLELLADTSAQWPNPNRAQANETLGAYNRVIDGASEHDDPESNGPEWESTIGSEIQHRYSPSNTYYASASFKKAVGHVFGSRLTQEQLQLIRSQVRGAHRLGLRARYWGVPAWPVGLRNHIWHILIREGVDVLSVDNLRQATTSDWRRKKGLLI